MANTSRENRIEELGRVDAEKGKTKKGKKNLWAEKKRIRKELKAKAGTLVTAKGGTMIKAKKGFGKKLAKAAAVAGAAYLGSKYLKKPGYKNVHETGAITQTPGGKWGPGVGGKQHVPKGKNLFSEIWGGAKKGASVKAKAGKMVKARGGAYIKTKLNGTLFTETF